MENKIADEEIEEIRDLVSKSYSRMCGTNLDLEIKPFPVAYFTTKSKIYGIEIAGFREGEPKSIKIPHACIAKRYIEHHDIDKTDKVGILSGWSEDYDTERIILGQGIENPARDLKLYPELYSKDVHECNDRKWIIREYIPESEIILNLAKKQLGNGGLKWNIPNGTYTLSHVLYPIALHHVCTPHIKHNLLEKGLMKTSASVESVDISKQLSRRFMKNIERFFISSGEKIKSDELNKITEDLFEISKAYLGAQNLQCIINGELDVFPHHVARNRLLDAGGVEVGAFTRDLALFSDPIFNSLWTFTDLIHGTKLKAESLVEMVLEPYIQIRNDLENDFKYPVTEFDREFLTKSFYLASFLGNIRNSAANLKYTLREEEITESDFNEMGKEIKSHLSNSLTFLDAFIKDEKDNIMKDKARRIYDFLKRNRITADKYKLSFDLYKNSQTSEIKNETGKSGKVINVSFSAKIPKAIG